MFSPGCVIHSQEGQRGEQQAWHPGDSHLNLTTCSGKRTELQAALSHLHSRSADSASGSSRNWSLAIACDSFPVLIPGCGFLLFAVVVVSTVVLARLHFSAMAEKTLPVVKQLVPVLMAKVSVLALVLQKEQGRVRSMKTKQQVAAAAVLGEERQHGWCKSWKRRVSSHQLGTYTTLRLFPLFIAVMITGVFCILIVLCHCGAGDCGSFCKPRGALIHHL